MTKFPSLAAMVLTTIVSGVFAQNPASITTVEVFANAATHVQVPPQSSYRVRIYRLDAMQQVADQLSLNLPRTESEAKAYMLQHEAQIRRRYKDQITNAANGVSLATHYRLDRLPAVVINQRSVIYGVPDVDRAVALYLQAGGGR